MDSIERSDRSAYVSIPDRDARDAGTVQAVGSVEVQTDETSNASPSPLLDSPQLETAVPQIAQLPPEPSLFQVVAVWVLKDSAARVVAVAFCTCIYLTCICIIAGVFNSFQEEEKHSRGFLWGILTCGGASVALAAWLGRNIPVEGLDQLQELLPCTNPAIIPSERVVQLDYLVFAAVACVILQSTNLDRPGGRAHNPTFWFEWAASFAQPWAMPSFAFSLGCYVRDARPTLDNCKRAMRVAAGYFVLQVVFFGFLQEFWLLKDSAEPGSTTPYQADAWNVITAIAQPIGPLWFVYALFIWKLLTPYWMELQHPVSWAALWSLLCGFFVEDAEGDTQRRVLTYLIYYVLGVVVAQENLPAMHKFISNPQVRAWGAVMLCLHISVAWYLTHLGINRQCNYFVGDKAYDQMHCSTTDHHKANLTSYWPNVFVKLASIPVAVTLILAFSALMPRSDSVIQRAGMRALCPYIFHYHFLLGIWKYTKWLDDWELKHSIPLYLCLAIYVWVLYLPIVYRVVSQIIFMPLDKMGIFKED